jgi:hypothetical protein
MNVRPGVLGRARERLVLGPAAFRVVGDRSIRVTAGSKIDTQGTVAQFPAPAEGIVVHGSGRHRARRNARDDCHSANGRSEALADESSIAAAHVLSEHIGRWRTGVRRDRSSRCYAIPGSVIEVPSSMTCGLPTEGSTLAGKWMRSGNSSTPVFCNPEIPGSSRSS